MMNIEAPFGIAYLAKLMPMPRALGEVKAMR